MRILTTEQMRAIDRRAIDELGIPSMVLMENAAIGVVDALTEAFPDVRRIAIYCGPGNNGGDGLAIGRHLAIRGYDVQLLVVTGGRALEGDAAAQLEICRRQGLALQEVAAEAVIGAVAAAGRDSDLIVDALFGTGLGRPLQGLFADLVESFHTSGVPVVAVDLPSGLDAGSANVPGPHARAALTVTFAAPKIAHVLPPACHAVGEVAVTDLGIPPQWTASGSGDLELLEQAWLAAYLPSRPAAGHKGDFGHLLLVAGSTGKSGAAVLAARGAVRSGAGLVTVATPESVVDAVEIGSVESMTLPLPAQEIGEVSAAAAAILVAAEENRTVVAMGPGMGRSAGATDCIRQATLEISLPLILDADGINAFAGDPGQLRERSAPTCLTPHPGELARLLGIDTVQVVHDRLAAVRRASEETGAVVVLKGFRSLIATPEGRLWVNPTGNSGMGTGGTGDVLTGVIGGLMAQGIEVEVAAALGVFVHGLAGDLAAAEHGARSMGAGDLLDFLPAALEQLESA